MSSNSADAQVETSCTTKLKSHEVRFSWTIEDFDFHESRGEELKSPEFSAITNDKYVFYLWLYPNGLLVKKGDNCVSLFLVLKFPDGIDSLSVKFTLDCLSQKKKVWSHSTEVREFTRTGKSWGMTAVLIPKEAVLFDNKLTMRVHVTFAEKNVINNLLFRHKSETPEGNLSSSFASLFEQQELSDVTISVKNKDYPVHKCILFARSPVFAAMFKHDTKENQLNRVTIEDIEENVMEEMLKYIYTGKCEILDSLVEGLLAAADKYALDDLKTICSSKLMESLSVENAANTLLLAGMYRVDVLKSETIKFIVGKPGEVFKTDDWRKVLSVPELIGEVCQAMAFR